MKTMSSITLLPAVLLVLCLVRQTSALSSGAPTSVCVSMVPGHSGITPQSSTAPFNISTSVSSYSANQEITVTITATGGAFYGFLLQARRADPSLDTDSALGVFTAIANTKTINCGSGTGNALTHTNGLTNSFTSLVVKWTAPNPAPGHIIFKATIATARETYWLSVTSDMVSDPTAPAIVTTVATTQATATDNTLIDLSGCGSTKGCLKTSSTCTQSTCDGIVTWVDTGNGFIDFEMSRTGEGWMGLGFSLDRSMGSDSVIECLRSPTSGSMSVSQSYNNGRANQEIANPRDEGISNVTVGYVSGVQVCRFRRQKAITGRDTVIFDLTNEYYLLIALGNSFDDTSSVSNPVGITKHNKVPTVSSAKASFSQNVELSGSASIPSLVKGHGSMMLFAWAFFVPVGRFFPYFYKDFFGEKKLFGFDVWFPVHVGCMLSALLFTIIGFILIFVHAGGYSSLTNAGSDYLRAHPILGIIITILVIVNPIMGFLRPAKDSEHRPIFLGLHRFVAISLAILSWMNLFSGLFLPSVTSALKPTVLYLFISLVCFIFIWEMIMWIYSCVMHGKNTNKCDDNPDSSNQTSGKDFQMTEQKETCRSRSSKECCTHRSFRQTMLQIYISALFGISLAALINLCTS